MSRQFYLGYFTSVMIMNIYQDGLGMEKYIANVRSGWMDTSIWFWFSILVFGYSLWAVFELKEALETIKSK